MTLPELRREIDRIDEGIVLLLNERADTAKRVGEEKRKEGLSVHDADREKQVLEHVKNLNCGPLTDDKMEKIYRQIMGSCSELQVTSE